MQITSGAAAAIRSRASGSLTLAGCAPPPRSRGFQGTGPAGAAAFSRRDRETAHGVERTRSGIDIEVRAPVEGRLRELLNPDALSFLALLDREFEGRRRELL